MNKKYILIALGLFLMLGVQAYADIKINPSQTTIVTPLEIVKFPDKYLNKPIKMNVVFDKFTTLGLDYGKVNRSSEKYIGFLIQRSDITDHNIPLSEMKLFLKREYAEKFIDLDTGDKLEISGVVISNALGDPWVDVDKIVVKEKIKKEEK